MASSRRMYLGAAVASVAFAVAVPAVAAPAHPLSMTPVLASQANGAACLDGSPQRYWIAANASSTKWTVHMQGGGWCESVADCASRAFSYLGSSNTSYYASQAPGNGISGLSAYSDPMDLAYIPSCLGARWCGGLMMNDTSHNAVTATWNKVFIRYCDGLSFTGANMTLTHTTHAGQAVALYFRGALNLAAVLDSLVSTYGLGAATELVLSGDSAGGLATYHHVDYIAARLPGARVVGAPDSGFFFSYPSYPSWPSTLKACVWRRSGDAALDGMAALQNSTSGLNAACVAAAAAAGTDPVACILPEVAAPHVAAPLFVLNSRYDPALDSISAGIGQGDRSAVEAVGASLLALVNATVLSRAGNAAFITSCAEHCGQWAQAQTLGPPSNPHQFDDFNATVVTSSGGVTAMQAFASWYAANDRTAPSQLWLQDSPYPCPGCCHGAPGH